MSEVTALTVHIIQVKNNFVHLHSKLLGKYKHPKNPIGCMKLKIGSITHYVSCFSTPFNGNGENSLNINSEFARTLNLLEFDTVIVSNIEYTKSLKTVHASPMSVEDLQILNSSAEVIQSSLLDQVQIVRVHQILNIWIMKSFSLKIHIDDLDHGLNFGKLEEYTEVIVSINVNQCVNCEVKVDENLETDSPSLNPWNFLKNIFNLNLRNQLESVENPPVEDVLKFSPLGIYRCTLAKSDWLYSTHNVPYHPYVVFVSRKYCPQFSHYVRKEGYSLCRLTNIPFENSKLSKIKIQEKTISDTLSSPNLFVHLYLIGDNCENKHVQMLNCYPTIFVSHSIFHSWNLKINSKVNLDFVSGEENLKVTQIDFTIIRLQIVEKLNLTDEVKNVLQNYVKLKNCVILNNGQLFTMHEGKDVLYVSFNPVNLPFIELNESNLDSCNFRLVEKRLNINIDKSGVSSVISPFSFQSQVVEELETNLLIKLRLLRISTDYDLENYNHVIVEGETGCGKSAILDILSEKISCNIFTKKLECKALKGKLISKLEKIFQSALTECVYQQPAILCLDDLDVLFSLSKHNAQQQSESSVSSYSNRLSHMIVETIRRYLHHHIAIIATATNLSSFERCLFDSRGSSLFSVSLRIPVMNREMREESFNYLMKQVTETDFEYLPDFSRRTEGYCIQDICDLVDRVYFEMLKRQYSESSDAGSTSAQVLKVDIEEAFSNFTPLALCGIDLHKNSSVSWNNVGGLFDAKKTLTEILIWPSRYPKIFDQCPLKMQSGVLLYGAPGSGKTLLAGAVAGESGLNFISIKGPELLSKFVGESEEGVRNTFKRAQNAKPCILFFDEFDSLAPRRGNDITGVTDRVVNQLLTELDGVESVSGVWVLAATSRPDLIDPALLRPGRLGTTIYCPLPSENDRCDILKVHCASFGINYRTDFKNIAKLTEGYTGADLRAVLHSAIIKSDSRFGESDVQAQGVTIDTDCLIEAVRETSASLKTVERKMFENMYEKFQRKNEKYELLVDQKLSYA